MSQAYDFEAGVNFLVKDICEEMNKGLSYQTYSFDSNSFNQTMSLIQNRVNTLYEKTRVLEDAIGYAKDFLEENIYSYSQRCRDILKSIEETRDSIKHKGYVSFDVPFISDAGLYVDRDGSELPICDVSNSYLTLSGIIATEAKISSVTRSASLIPYRSNLDQLKSNGFKNYRTFYIFDAPVVNGIKEELVFFMETPEYINFIDITPANCSILSIAYIDENGRNIQGEITGVATQELKIKAVKIILGSELYKTISYDVDLDRMHSSFWDKIKESEYNKAIGGSTVADIDELAGMKRFKSDYESYVLRLKDWLEDKEYIDSVNRSNGYSVPSTNNPLNGIQVIERSVQRKDPYPTAEQKERYTSTETVERVRYTGDALKYEVPDFLKKILGK